MAFQDLILAAHFLLFSGTVLRGVTKPVHNQTHVLIVVTALFLPFVSFDLARLGDVPFDAWLFCAAFLGMQVVHTVFHYLRPAAVHAVGPEILATPTALMVTLAIVFRDPVWLVAAVAVFAGVRALLPPERPAAVTRGASSP